MSKLDKVEKIVRTELAFYRDIYSCEISYHSDLLMLNSTVCALFLFQKKGSIQRFYKYAKKSTNSRYSRYQCLQKL